MDCRGASGLFIHVFPLPLAVCLYFTKWIFGFTSDRDAFEVEKGKRRLFFAGGRRIVFNTLLISSLIFNSLSLGLFIWLHSCDLERLTPRCCEG